MSRHICPVWLGPLLVSGIRKRFQEPEKILAPYVKPGMWALDIGCAMGFFSLPLARMVGEKGRVVCVDVQERMIQALVQRVRREGLYPRVDMRICGWHSLGLGDLRSGMDFALASAMVHEVSDPERLMAEVYDVLKPEGVFLVLEPRGHVSPQKMETSIARACRAGFEEMDRPRVSLCRSVLLKKKK